MNDHKRKCEIALQVSPFYCPFQEISKSTSQPIQHNLTHATPVQVTIPLKGIFIVKINLMQLSTNTQNAIH